MSKQQATMLSKELACPICSFTDTDEYALRLHVEHVHFGGGEFINEPVLSTGVVDAPILDHRADPKHKADSDYVVCTECGEEIVSINLQEHLDFHLAERLGLEEQAAQFNTNGNEPWAFDEDLHDSGVDLTFEGSRDGSPQDGELEVRRWAHLDQNTRRLGKKNLGPHAFEAKMPDPIRKLLAKENQSQVSTIGANGRLVKGVQQHVNRTRNVVPLLGSLLEADTDVKEAWLCSDTVQYIYKLKGEGSFCGYRNMQMMLSYVASSQTGLSLPSPNGHISGQTQCCGDFIDVDAANGIPDVLHLQDLIETAWDHGFNPGGRIETGGLIGTRKYIGTPEAYALFQFLRLHSWSHELSQNEAKHSQMGSNISAAYTRLLQKVEDYFKKPPNDRPQWTKDQASSTHTAATSSQSVHGTKVHHTQLAPIYLQAPGHSVTVVGLEISTDGTRNLLVFDPSYGPGKDVSRLLALADKQSSSPKKQAASSASSQGLRSKNTTSQVSRETSDFFVKRTRDSAATSASASSDLASTHTTTTSPYSTKRKREESTSVAQSSSRRPRTANGKVWDTVAPEEAKKLLLPYRRGEKHLSRNNTFELLMLGGM